MAEAVTPPNPDQTDSGRHGNPPQSVPDPTLMTIDALRREIAMLESLMSAKIDANEELTSERFHRIDQMITHFERQRQEQKADTREAVDAALDAQKESTQKMESSFAKQIASLLNNFDTSIRAIESNIIDLKERMTIAESVRQGMHAQKEERREITAGQVAAIGLAITLLLAILAILGVVLGSSS